MQTRFPLGRHYKHDRRSKSYAITPAARAPKSARHHRHCQAFVQGNINCCTGTALAGVLMTDPFWTHGRRFTEADAIWLYSKATHLDNIRGTYPPTDAGSSGLAVCKAAKQSGWITRYEHAFGWDQLLHGLSQRPGILGINWYTSFYWPAATGECSFQPRARVSGGHEVQMFRLDVERQRVWCYQSWGPAWGGRNDGTFWFSFATLRRLFAEEGDAIFPCVG